jgi:3-hydroxyisobutyrate dehydrogenase-like beta-hydroxyacid dehydrogenase
MAKLGFLGLGTMGVPMARHLLEAGRDLFEDMPGCEVGARPKQVDSA